MSFKKGFILAFIAVFAALTCGAAVASIAAAEDSVISIVEGKSDHVWREGSKDPVKIVVSRPVKAGFKEIGTVDASGEYERLNNGFTVTDSNGGYIAGDKPEPEPTPKPTPGPSPTPSPAPSSVSLVVTAEPQVVKASDTSLTLKVVSSNGADLPKGKQKFRNSYDMSNSNFVDFDGGQPSFDVTPSPYFVKYLKHNVYGAVEFEVTLFPDDGSEPLSGKTTVNFEASPSAPPVVGELNITAEPNIIRASDTSFKLLIALKNGADLPLGYAIFKFSGKDGIPVYPGVLFVQDSVGTPSRSPSFKDWSLDFVKENCSGDTDVEVRLFKDDGSGQFVGKTTIRVIADKSVSESGASAARSKAVSDAASDSEKTEDVITVSDPSMLDADDDGNALVEIRYSDGGETYRTTATVRVVSKGGSRSSGGCSAGFGVVALSALAFFALRRK